MSGTINTRGEGKKGSPPRVDPSLKLKEGRTKGEMNGARVARPRQGDTPNSIISDSPVSINCTDVEEFLSPSA